jgi:hypothetical protein
MVLTLLPAKMFVQKKLGGNRRAGANEMAAPFFSLSSPIEERAGEAVIFKL